MTSLTAAMSRTSRNSRTCFLQPHSRLFLLWSLWITISWIVNPIDCSCQIINKVISCRYNYMSDEQLQSMDGTYDMILSDMQTNFTTDRKEKSSGAKIQTMQIQKSTIYNLTPKFFARYSDNNLQSLIMSSVKGSYGLNAHTLGGLENSLKTLRINDYELKDLSYLVMLKQLDSLHLVRTKLQELPPNFKDVLNQLKSLDLSENELTTMPWKYLAERVQSYDFHKVQLNKNKWHCDCSLEPILKLTPRMREKIAYFRCHTPTQVQRNTLSEINFAEICPKSLLDKDNEESESDLKPVVNEDINQSNMDLQKSSSKDSTNKDAVQGPVGTNLATAGSLSPEVIAVIVAGALLLLIIILAAVIYKVRKRSSERRQQERNRGLAHKTNSYCAVIEHNPPGRTGGGKPPSQLQQQQQQPNIKTNNYGRNAGLPPEREPLAHGYPVNYKDREL